MDGKKLGAVLVGTGIATVVVGLILKYRDGKSPQALLGSTTKTTKNGMTLTHYRGRIPIKKRIGLLQDLVYKSVQDPRMRQIALDATKNCKARDGECETRAVYNAIKNRVRYTGDVAPIKLGSSGPVEAVDFFQSAYRTWELQGGDCDDHSVLAATLLSLNGIQPKFKITSKTKSAGDDDWSHIYVVAGLPKNTPEKWLAVDTTLPGSYFNVEAPYGKSKEFPA